MLHLPPTRLLASWLLVFGLGWLVWWGLTALSIPGWLRGPVFVLAAVAGGAFAVLQLAWTLDDKSPLQ